MVIVASLLTGCPSSETVKVTFAMLPSRSTEVTSPTLTPAILTGDVGLSVIAVWNVAFSSYPRLVNGMRFVNARMKPSTNSSATTSPIIHGLGPR
jgi:hypothetical protein